MFIYGSSSGKVEGAVSYRGRRLNREPGCSQNVAYIEAFYTDTEKLSTHMHDMSSTKLLQQPYMLDASATVLYLSNTYLCVHVMLR